MWLVVALVVLLGIIGVARWFNRPEEPAARMPPVAEKTKRVAARRRLRRGK
jgi:hypothetical protein